MTAHSRFADIAEPPPTQDGLAAAYRAIAPSSDRGDRAGAMADWDRLRRRYDTWSALVHLRFAQDTTDEAAKADRDYADALSPEAADLEIALKRRLLADPDRAGLAAAGRANTHFGCGKPMSPPSIPSSSLTWKKKHGYPRATPNCWPRQNWRSPARR